MLSTFELVRRYRPISHGRKSTLIFKEVIEEHKHVEKINALHRLQRSQQPHSVPAELFVPGSVIYFHCKSSKQNEPIEWRADSVKG